jgi:CheY-like chemotaxis protein
MPDGPLPSPKWIALLEEYRAERDELRRRMQLIPQVRQDASVQLAEFQKALLSIRQARDSLLGQVHTLSQSRDRTEGRIDELLQELEEAREDLNISRSELEATKRACDDLRGQVQAFEGRAPHSHGTEVTENPGDTTRGPASPADSDRESVLAAQLAAAQSQITALETHLERSSEQIKESNARLIQKLITSEKSRAAATEAAESAQTELAAVTAERAALQEELKQMESRVAILEVEVGRLSVGGTLEDQIKRQQQQIAELSAALDAARDELRLAWAIKQATEQAEAGADHVVFADPTPPPLNGAEADLAVAAMRSCLQAATESLEPEKHLQSLDEHLQKLAQRALCAGWLSTRRVLELCSDITRWLQKFPVKVESMAHPLEEALNLVRRIANAPDPTVHEDTDGFEVYAVDDDVDNCECIAMSLDKIALRTLYASKPEIALTHLAAKHSKLIILDVDLGGGVSGFEIHAAIRRMSHHRKTPILFVSALTSAKDRVEEMGFRYDAYLAKPYNLNEITLKTLSMILEARLAA